MRIATLIVVLLAGCATSGGEVTEARESWVGATYDEVVLRWGTAARSTKLTDGRNVYTWVSSSVGSRGGSSVGFGIGGSSGGGTGSSGGLGIGTGIMFGTGGGEPVRCERTLIFKDGRVVEQNWQGPAEYCKSFGRSAR
jgi:hypothetical protein